jgi:hypothetical protein
MLVCRTRSLFRDKQARVRHPRGRLRLVLSDSVEPGGWDDRFAMEAVTPATLRRELLRLRA